MTSAVNGEARGPEEIRAAFAAAIDATGGHADDLTGMAVVLGEAAERYETLQMSPSTLELLRGGGAAVAAAAASLGAAGEQLQSALTDFETHDGRVGDAVAEAGNLMQAEGYTAAFDPHSPSGATEEVPMSPDISPADASSATASSSGRPPQHPDAAGALWIDPHDGNEGIGRIVKRTKSTADIEWPNGRVEKGVKFTDPDRYGTWQWLTQQQLDAENAATRWPERIRGGDGLVGLEPGEEGVTITAGTAQQLAGIDPEAWRHRGDERYAYFDQGDDLPKLRRALGAAGRAAKQGKTYRKKVDGSDIGDVELSVTPQQSGDTPVTLTVLPYADIGAADDRKQAKESDFGTVPDQVEDDDHEGRMRPLTAEERSAWQADIRADYETWLAENPLPEPLVVTLSVPVVDRLRDRLSRTAADNQDGPA